MTAPAIPKPRIMETLNTSYKLKRAETLRIDALGRMNDRRMRYLAEGNRVALLELAIEYESFGEHGGCPRLAAEIRKEAEGLRGNYVNHI